MFAFLKLRNLSFVIFGFKPMADVFFRIGNCSWVYKHNPPLPIPIPGVATKVLPAASFVLLVHFDDFYDCYLKMEKVPYQGRAIENKDLFDNFPSYLKNINEVTPSPP